MDTFLAWVWAPVALYLLVVGVALLAERVVRFRLPNGLLGPVGFCLSIVVVMPVYRAGGNTAIALPLLLLVALLGYALARTELPARLNPGYAGLAALGAYGLYLAPVALSGHWTWPGYNFVNDTAANLVFIDLITHHGIVGPRGLPSTTNEVAAIVRATGYPLGAHALLATLRPVTFAPAVAVYQPFIAAMAGFGAMALARLARTLRVAPAAAVLAAVLAMGANLAYQYGQHGAIKELAMAAILAAAVALAREVVDAGLPLGGVGLLGACLASMLEVFSAAGAVYAGAVAVIALALALVGRDRVPGARLARGLALGAGVLLVAAAPALVDVSAFGSTAQDNFAAHGGGSTGVLGHLARPLPLSQAVGAWFSDDYRFPAVGTRATFQNLAIALIAACALLGAVVELRRRRVAALALFAVSAITALVLIPRVSPYADAKVMLIASPSIVFLAALGAWWAGRWRVAAGVLLAVPVAAAVLFSDALAYHQVKLGPTDRVTAMEDVAAHAARYGQHFVLLNEFEEWGKYFMRKVPVVTADEERSERAAVLRHPAPLFGFSYDLDQLRLDYVERWRSIIIRRSPAASRPPADYRLAYRNRFYELWRKAPGLRVLEHLPLQPLDRADARPQCSTVRAMARNTPRGAWLVAAEHPPTTTLPTLGNVDRSYGWVANPGIPGTVIPTSPGVSRGVRQVAAGRFEVWLRGDFGRAVDVLVDGRRVERIKGINTPGQWLGGTVVALRSGTHRLELRRGGGSLRPGDGYNGIIGPLALMSTAPERLVQVAPRDADRELCGKRWDWIERVARSAG